MIYYVYLKSDGSFQGSGITFFDDEIYGSTDIPCPEYDGETQCCFFRNGEWVIEQL